MASKITVNLDGPEGSPHWLSKKGKRPPTASEKEQKRATWRVQRAIKKSNGLRSAEAIRPMQAAADAHLKKLTVAFRYAFALGRKALGKKPNAEKAAKAIEAALLDVLPKTLLKIMVTGGETGLALLRKLRTAEFNPDQERDEQGQWTSGGSSSVSNEKAQSFLKEAGEGQVYEGRSSVIDRREGMLYRGFGFKSEADAEKFLKDGELSGRGVYGEATFLSPDPDYATTYMHGQVGIIVEIDPQGLTLRQSRSDTVTTTDKIKFDSVRRIGILKAQPDSSLWGAHTKTVKTLEGMRTLAGPFTVHFDPRNPNAKKWAEEHAAELAKDISKTTRQAIKDAMALTFETGEDPYDAILDAVGNDARAELIARTETMTAVHEGQRQGWDQAVEERLLTGDEKRVWIATEGACPLCEGLDGTKADLDDDYEDGVSGPPAHPNCRCTEGLSN